MSLDLTDTHYDWLEEDVKTTTPARPHRAPPTLNLVQDEAEDDDSDNSAEDGTETEDELADGMSEHDSDREFTQTHPDDGAPSSAITGSSTTYVPSDSELEEEAIDEERACRMLTTLTEEDEIFSAESEEVD